MNEKTKVRVWMALYGALLLAFTIYVLLDAFVIERSYTVIETNQGESFASPSASFVAENTMQIKATPEPTAAPVITETSYESKRLSVQLTTYRVGETDVHVASVVVSEAGQLKTALARNTYGRNITEYPSDMAMERSAVLAMNGDYYGAQRRGYVVRNGVLYRDSALSSNQEDLCVWPDGRFTVIREGDVSAQTLIDEGVTQVFSFGPGLVLDGEVHVTQDQEVGNAMVNNPRTAIAMVTPLHYLFVVADGRTEESVGLTLYELAQVLQELGADVAYNLDGGGSSVMIFMNEIVNFPTTRGNFNERTVSDIVYVSE